MKSFATLFLALIFSLNIFADTVSDQEKNALIKLNHATNGLQWKIKWDLSLSVATWHGVDVENGKVVALTLADNNLEGELPVDFFGLTNLIKLDLHKNRLKGTLPDAICNCKELQFLDLSSNKFSGELPAEIGKLTNLEVLSLFANEIQGHLPDSIYNITTLKVLLLNNNKLSGSLSKEIIKLTELQNLSLFDNNLEGEIPNEIGKQQHLSELNLSYNKFSGEVSKRLIALDFLNMTMLDENDNPFLLKNNTEKEITIVTPN